MINNGYSLFKINVIIQLLLDKRKGRKGLCIGDLPVIASPGLNAVLETEIAYSGGEVCGAEVPCMGNIELQAAPIFPFG